jgi:hypothetical protein
MSICVYGLCVYGSLDVFTVVYTQGTFDTTLTGAHGISVDQSRWLCFKHVFVQEGERLDFLSKKV